MWSVSTYQISCGWPKRNNHSESKSLSHTCQYQHVQMRITKVTRLPSGIPKHPINSYTFTKTTAWMLHNCMCVDMQLMCVCLWVWVCVVCVCVCVCAKIIWPGLKAQSFNSQNDSMNAAQLHVHAHAVWWFCMIVSWDSNFFVPLKHCILLQGSLHRFWKLYELCIYSTLLVFYGKKSTSSCKLIFVILEFHAAKLMEADVIMLISSTFFCREACVPVLP